MITITSTELGGTGRYINLGSPSAHDNLTARTVMALCRPAATATNQLLYLFAKSPTGAGPRFLLGTGSSASTLYFALGFNSATAAAPRAGCVQTTLTNNEWVNLCGTHTGSINSSDICLYVNAGSRLSNYVDNTANGTGALTSDAADDLCLLNRTSDYARPFLGDVAYIAQWNRVLSAYEISEAHTNGPGAVPDGLILLWANQQDYSSIGLTPTARSTYASGAIPSNTALGIDDADITAPTLSSPTSSSTGATSGSGGVTTNEGNGTLYAVATTSATKPGGPQIKAGQDHTGAAAPWSGNQAVTSTGAKSVTVTGLSASTAYYLHFMHEDAAANQSDVATSASFTTDTPDTTAPTLTGASATATGSTAATGSVSTNEATGTLYFIQSVNASESAPSVKAGYSQPVTEIGSQSVSVTGLDADTTYHLHFVHRDAAGNDSAVASSAQFTTAASYTTSVETVGDTNNFNPTGTSVANADTNTPTVTIIVRAQTVVDVGPWPGTSTSWRQFFGKITNVAGKTPTFKVLKTNGIEIDASRRPWYSYDLETWTQWGSASIVGEYLQFGGVTFLGDVYIALQPGWTVGKTATYLSSIASNKPSLIHELPSSGTDYIFTTLPAQTDELSRTIPAQPFYGFGIWDDAISRDGGDKRSVVITCGIHPGEHVGHWLFKGFIDFLLSDDAKAVELRKYYQFIVYPDINPLGKYGGHWRGQWDTDDLDKNANRDYSDYYGETPFSLNSSAALRDALALDADGRNIICHLDFHGQQDAPTGKAAAYAFYPDTLDSTILSNTLSRLQAYNALYELKSTVSFSMLAGFMLDTYGCAYSFTPEAYERRVCSAGTQDFETVGAHFAQVLADSLADMSWDGLIPALSVSIPLAFANAAPAKLQGFLATSNLSVTNQELKDLLDGV